MTSHKSLVIVSRQQVIYSKRIKAKSLLQTIGRRLFCRRENWAGRRTQQCLIFYIILFVLPFIFLLCVVLSKNDQVKYGPETSIIN